MLQFYDRVDPHAAKLHLMLDYTRHPSGADDPHLAGRSEPRAAAGTIRSSQRNAPLTGSNSANLLGEGRQQPGIALDEGEATQPFGGRTTATLVGGGNDAARSR